MHARQGPRSNARLTPDELDSWAPLDTESVDLLERAARGDALSARAIHATRRVARSLADLAGRDAIQREDVAAAIALRGPEP